MKLLAISTSGTAASPSVESGPFVKLTPEPATDFINIDTAMARARARARSKQPLILKSTNQSFPSCDLDSDNSYLVERCSSLAMKSHNLCTEATAQLRSPVTLQEATESDLMRGATWERGCLEAEAWGVRLSKAMQARFEALLGEIDGLGVSGESLLNGFELPDVRGVLLRGGLVGAPASVMRWIERSKQRAPYADLSPIEDITPGVEDGETGLTGEGVKEPNCPDKLPEDSAQDCRASSLAREAFRRPSSASSDDTCRNDCALCTPCESQDDLSSNQHMLLPDLLSAASLGGGKQHRKMSRQQDWRILASWDYQCRWS